MVCLTVLFSNKAIADDSERSWVLNSQPAIVQAMTTMVYDSFMKQMSLLDDDQFINLNEERVLTQEYNNNAIRWRN